MDRLWKFDKSIASNFVEHARCHIPDYDKVIDISVELCKNFKSSEKIIDVGCATGETLRRLELAGFTNLFGVDDSQDMLDLCKTGKTILSNVFPSHLGTFKVIIINWTLHFIRDKKEYLKSVIKNLDDDGLLIISDKIDNREFALKYYHDFKKKQGVSEEDIESKAKSLVGVMFVQNLDWYIDTFKDLNIDYYLANGHWSFATFVCRKKMP